MNKLLAALLLMAAPTIAAQPSSAQAQAQMQSHLEPSQFVNAAGQIISAIDSGQAGTLWDGGSEVLKASMPRNKFIQEMNSRTQASGRTVSWDWYSIQRVQETNPSAQLPPGNYVSVSITARNQAGAVFNGIISFRHESDGHWRLAGYAK